MKKIKIIAIVTLLIFFLIFFLYNYIYFFNAKVALNKRGYKGIIEDIRTVEGRRGLPDIKINDNWINLSLEESKVKNYILIGDSIVKDSGISIMEVFRKNKKGEWYVKGFY